MLYPKLAELADFLETVDDSQFDMTAFEEQHNCGTAFCLGGWAVARKFGKVLCPEVRKLEKPVENIAADILEIPFPLGWALFYPLGRKLNRYADITKPVAIHCLRQTAQTGEVDWDEALTAAKQ